jgi:hypothetical protein
MSRHNSFVAHRCRDDATQLEAPQNSHPRGKNLKLLRLAQVYSYSSIVTTTAVSVPVIQKLEIAVVTFKVLTAASMKILDSLLGCNAV